MLSQFESCQGVCSAGLRTQAQPAASAGANFHAAIRSGNSTGMICPATPTGSLSVSSLRCREPDSRNRQPLWPVRRNIRSRWQRRLMSTTRLRPMGLPVFAAFEVRRARQVSPTFSARRKRTPATFLRGRRGPCTLFESGFGGGYGAVHVIGAGVWDLGNNLCRWRDRRRGRSSRFAVTHSPLMNIW